MSEEKNSENVVIVPFNGQSGGRLVGQGVLGCIFSPALKCKNTKVRHYPDTVGKVSKSSETVKEVYVERIFSKNPLSKKYLILPKADTLCKELKPIRGQTEPDIMKCNVINPASDKAEPYLKLWQYEMDFGGVPLYKKIPTQIAHLPAKFDFFKFMLQMLEIGTFLALNGFVHNDLHEGNLLVDKAFNTRLIDFNRSFAVQQINKTIVESMFAYFEPELGQIPPEISAIDGINSGYTIWEITEAIRNKKPAIRLVEQILGITKTAQMNEFRNFFSSSPTMRTNNWIKFYKLYWPAIDAWGFGHILIKVLSKLHSLKTFYDTPEWSSKKFIIKPIIRGLLRTSARERIDCVEALSMYDPTNKLLLTKAGRAWLEKKDAIRKRQGVMRGGGNDFEENDSMSLYDDGHPSFAQYDELNALF
jgi:hypothetical protein